MASGHTFSRALIWSFYWFVIIVLAFLCFVIMGAGYWIIPNRGFVISDAPEFPDEGPYLQHHRAGTIVRDITGYAPVADTVAGRTEHDWFLATSDGQVLMFQDRASWLSACRDLDTSFDGRLKTPSLVRNPFLFGMLLAFSCMILLLLAAGRSLQRWVDRHLPPSTRATGFPIEIDPPETQNR